MPPNAEPRRTPGTLSAQAAKPSRKAPGYYSPLAIISCLLGILMAGAFVAIALTLGQTDPNSRAVLLAVIGLFFGSGLCIGLSVGALGNPRGDKVLPLLGLAINLALTAFMTFIVLRAPPRPAGAPAAQTPGT